MFRDCYAHFDRRAGEIRIGNDVVEKKIFLNGSMIRTAEITEKKNHVCWAGETSLWQRCPVLGVEEKPEPVFEAYAVNDRPGIKPHLKAVLTLGGSNGTAWYEWLVFPEIPFVYFQAFASRTGEIVLPQETGAFSYSNGTESRPDRSGEKAVFCSADTLDCIPLINTHLEVEAFELCDKSDNNDALLQRRTVPLYARGYLEREGNLFRISDEPGGNSLMLVKHSPTPSSALCRRHKDLQVMGTRYAALMGTGVDFQALSEEKTPYYASAVGAAPTERLLDELWRYNTAMSKGEPRKALYTMSNTWGDRSQDMCVCEEFILKEIERAHELGVNAVEIDDGWQRGCSANSLRRKDGVWEGYYKNDSRFWEVNLERFPHGLQPIIEKAQSYGIDLGLWFSPDSSNEFENWERDVETISRLHQEYGARYIKLDGMMIRSKRSETRFIRMLEEVTRRFGDDVSFNLDVTAGDRFGYLYQQQYGTLYVENRYTDWGNYYPHKTFRNLWNLSAVLPPRRLQMELLNPRRNPQKYENMPFAPALYRMDYLFATILPANPLVFMEMIHLAPEDARVLSEIISVYRKYRAELFEAQVIPIGSEPNGMRFSGYLLRRPDASGGHLLLFREQTQKDECFFPLPLENAESMRLTPLYQSDPVTVRAVDGGVQACFAQQRSFAWLTWE